MPGFRNLPRKRSSFATRPAHVHRPSREAGNVSVAVLITLGFLITSGVLPVSAAPGVPACLADSIARTQSDPVGDATVRRTDLGGTGSVDPVAHRVPDIVSYSIGYWDCYDPYGNIFLGRWALHSDFFRLDIVFKGLVNPPGPLGCCGNPAFDPFLYGPHPALAYIELDIDENPDTGGELDLPDFRYLGNIGRFGGLPRGPHLATRAAVDDSAFDKNILTPPFVDRSGEDFHIELQNWNIETINYRSDASNMIFGPGETWRLTGRFFARAHGYEDFSAACCFGRPGSYWPRSRIQFSHNAVTDTTTVSLVYPLTNNGSYQMGNGKPYPEADDGDPSNQNSIHEALADLVYSVAIATPMQRASPNFAIIAPWEAQDPDLFMDPASWRVTIISGTSYTTQSPSAWFVWTDTHPNVIPGDFDGDGRVTLLDLANLTSFIAANDGHGSTDTDRLADGIVVLPRFGANFSVYDVDYDGSVSAKDIAAITALWYAPGDLDTDGDVDLGDFGRLQACLSGRGMRPPTEECSQADLDKDDDVDHDDMMLLVPCLSGAGVSADPLCGR